MIFIFITFALSGVPDAPSPPSVSDITPSSMTLSWEPPATDGGSTVTGYIVEKRESPVGRWVPVNRAPIKETTFKVNDLSEDRKYEFRVSAENAAGVGKPSEVSLPRVAKSPYGNAHINFVYMNQVLRKLITSPM